MEESGRVHALENLPQERTSLTFIAECVGCTAGLDILRKRKSTAPTGIQTGPPSLVKTQTMLTQLPP